MNKVTGLPAFTYLSKGTVLEFGDRLYKYDEEDNQVKYSDDNREWKASKITVNEMLQTEWHVYC